MFREIQLHLKLSIASPELDRSFIALERYHLDGRLRNHIIAVIVLRAAYKVQEPAATHPADVGLDIAAECVHAPFIFIHGKHSRLYKINGDAVLDILQSVEKLIEFSIVVHSRISFTGLFYSCSVHF